MDQTAEAPASRAIADTLQFFDPYLGGRTGWFGVEVGHRLGTHCWPAAPLEQFPGPLTPSLESFAARIGDRAAARDQEILPQQPVLGGRLLVHERGVPPDDVVSRHLVARPVGTGRCGKPVATGPDRLLGRAVVVRRSRRHRSIAELGAPLGGVRAPPVFRPRIHRVVQALDPPRALNVADRRHDEQVAGPRRRHVGDANALRFLSFVLDVRRVDELLRRQPEQLHRAQALLAPQRPLGPARQLGGHVRQDDDRELQALRRVDGHHADAVRVFLDHRRLRAADPLRLLVQLLHKTAERAAAGDLVAARQIADALGVAQHLVARGPERHRRLRARLGEDLLHGLHDRPIVPSAVKRAEEVENIDQGSELGRRLAVLPDPARRVEGMPVPVARSEPQQQIVVEGEEGAPKRRVHGQAVIRPLDRRERRPKRLDFLPFVEGPGTDQEMRNAEGLQTADIVAGRVLVPAQEAPEQHAHVPRLDRYPLQPARIRRIGDLDLPAALLDQPAHELDRRGWLARLDVLLGDVAVPVGPGRRQHDNLGLAWNGLAVFSQGYVVGASGRLVAGHQRREGRVDQPLNGCRGTEAGRKLQDLDATLREPLLDILIEHDIRPAEAVDRLLRIADQEQLSGGRRHPPPIVLVRVVGRQEEQNLGLERVRILELVDEQVGIACLQMAPHVPVAPQKVARLDQQVVEVELPEKRLRLLVTLDGARQFVLQESRQVGVRVALELAQAIRQPAPEFEDLIAPHAFREPAPSLARTPEAAQVAQQQDQPRLQLVKERLPIAGRPPGVRAA